MKEIDEMDILGFFKLRAWAARQDRREKERPPRRAYIDEVWDMPTIQ